MRKNIDIFILFVLLIIAIPSSGQSKYEIRAVWLTTIGGIDWPHSYAHNELQIQRQKSELIRILDQLKAAHINTVLLQTRIRATTIYPSHYEPWDGCLSGVPGKSPGYDALQFAIDECHQRGMELHAWVVTIPIGKWNATGCRMLRSKYPSLVRRIGDEGYMNPEKPLTADYLGNICEEIVSNYDVDGIHLDYIRYPETWKINIDKNRARHNITHIVSEIHQRVKLLKPWVKISCSPIGKFDDLHRYSSHGWNAYSRVYQDAQGWLRSGQMDMLFPMMYFKGNQFYPFAIDWQENSYGRMLAAGLGVYMLSANERNWDLAEIIRQLNVCRQLGMGHCFFRSKFLTDNTKGVFDFVQWFNRHPTAIPPMTWGNSIEPAAPTKLTVNRSRDCDEIAWSGAEDRSDGPYLTYNIYASTEWPVNTTLGENLLTTRYQSTRLSVSHRQQKPTLYYAITAVDRYGIESEPIQMDFPNNTVASTDVLLPNNGKTLTLPDASHNTDAGLIVIKSLQGKTISTIYYRKDINISHLPDGTYQLYTLNQQNVSHRLGFFFIKRKMTD